jgi:chromosome segregation ATPase
LFSEFSNLQGMVEMLTLDKALAEENVEELTSELQTLKSKLTNTELEVELLKESLTSTKDDLLNSLPSDVAGTLKLSDQNTQLATALTKLRDVSLAEKQTHLQMISKLEKENKELKCQSEELNKLKPLYTNAISSIDELKEKLEESSEYESMVEELSEKNSILDEKIKTLELNIKHFEDLNEANTEVEEGHIELELQLQNELDIKENEIQDINLKLKYKLQLIEDLNKTVRNFRDLVRHLEEDNKKLTNNNNNIIHSDLPSSSNLLLQQKIKEVRNSSVQYILIKCEMEQMKLRSEYICSYLPNNVNIDETSLTCISTIERIKFKIQNLCSIFHTYYGTNHLNIDMATVTYHICYILMECTKICEQATFIMQHIDQDTFNIAVNKTIIIN